MLDGRAKIVIRAKGSSLTLPTLPVTLPLRVQLQSSAGTCWEASFPTAKKNEARKLNARSN